jgi:hypothetical protein
MGKKENNHGHGHGYHEHHDERCREALRLECVITCAGFPDLLDVTLSENHAHFDNVIVVTTHADKATQNVARNHSATCVTSDLFFKNGRSFNKGAAINAGFDYFQYHGWRMHLDADILLPDSFRRILFNHSHLEQHCLYGADRVNIVGNQAIRALVGRPQSQHHHKLLVGESGDRGDFGHRLVCSLRGYLPLGFFQLWHSSCQKPYPYSLGTAAHDDMMFSALWPHHCRRHLATVLCYHLCPTKPRIGQNWDGHRTIGRFTR